MIRTRRYLQSLGVVSLFTTGCQLWLGEYAADRSDPVETSDLCAHERSLFDVELDLDSNDQQDTLQAYYARANPDLVQQFDEVVDAAAVPSPTRTATYLMGEAGAGKSFMMRTLVNAFSGGEICDLSLTEVLAVTSTALPTEKLPDLATLNGSTTLNSLPGLSNPDAFSLPQFLQDQGCGAVGSTAPLVVLDGIDEVHPSSALAILREVEDYLLNGESAFVHVVVLGRPEGFAPWFAHPMRGEATGKVVDLLTLKTPMYVTRGDISFRLREYLDFTMQLADAQSSGRFDKYVDSVTSALDRYPFLRYSLSNLAVGNVVMQHTAPGLNESEFTLKTKIFEDLLARNVETHGRPGTGSRYDSAYIELFERVAATYTNVNSEGEFTVSPKDTLPLSDDSGNIVGELRVTTLLERSGLAYLASPTSTTKRFRFSPLWVHGYLAERFNQRTTPKYVYQGCE